MLVVRADSGIGNRTSNDLLAWIDLEMTGLDPENHVILEIATIITDGGLKIVAEGPVIAIYHPPEVFQFMEEWSDRHHTASGLLERCRESRYDNRLAEQESLEFINRYCPEGRVPLCGNSIWQDRRFLIRHMPRLEAFFHYRNVDVSSIKELVGRWYQDSEPFMKRNAHSALSDILESIEELKYYRKKFFR